MPTPHHYPQVFNIGLLDASNGVLRFQPLIQDDRVHGSGYGDDTIAEIDTPSKPSRRAAMLVPNSLGSISTRIEAISEFRW
jgi:hypothetical protein